MASVVSDSVTLWTVACQVHGILQARILEWVAMPSSGGSSQPRDQTASLMSPASVGDFFTTSATWEARQIAEVHVKGMNSVSPEACIFPLHRRTLNSLA